MKTNASSAHTTERISAAEAIGGLRSALDSAADYSDRLPGTRLRLRVQAVMPDGSFQVELDGKPAYVRASANVQTGAMVDVELVGTTPRPTFALRSVVSDAPVPRLSPTARLLAGIPGGAMAHSETAQLEAAAPVVTEPFIDTHKLAAALKGTITHSGLFYESHLAQWMSGRRSKEELLLEPQARLAPTRAHGESPITAIASVTSAGLPAATQVIHPDALPVVQQQLVVLDTSHVLWRGEVWNGQKLEWEIARESNRQHDDDPRTRWRTRLRITLPRLGRIDATIAVEPAGLDVQVQAREVPVADALAADIASLSRAMRASGLAVSRAEVTHATG